MSIRLHLPHDEIAARVQTPLRQPRQTVSLISGLHPAGIDEPRLVAFAHELARTGVTAVTPAGPLFAALCDHDIAGLEPVLLAHLGSLPDTH